MKTQMDGATMFNRKKALCLLIFFLNAVAVEMIVPSILLLQPIWNIFHSLFGIYLLSNVLFFGTIATCTYFITCTYFTYLDLTHSPTKCQKDYWPSTTEMWDAARPQMLIYGSLTTLSWIAYYIFPQLAQFVPNKAPSLFEFGWHLISCLLIGDFLIYWEHRIMHAIPYLRRNIHSVHHKYSAPFSWAGGWVHPIEDAVVVFCQAVPSMLLGIHPLTLYVFTALWVICLIDEHSGHDVWWSPYQILPFTGYPIGGGAAPHDIHHYKPRKNYGFVFIIWDRMFNTFEPVTPKTTLNPYVAPFCITRK